MQRKESAIEVKVGGLVLLAVAIFAGFILVLGDCNFSPGYQIFVRFENAAGLKPGAPVRLSGIPAGNVRAVKFEGGDQPVERLIHSLLEPLDLLAHHPPCLIAVRPSRQLLRELVRAQRRRARCRRTDLTQREHAAGSAAVAVGGTLGKRDLPVSERYFP